MKLDPNDLARIKAFGDRSAWLMVLAGGAVLGLTDWRLLLTLLTWTAYAAVLGGITILISRVTFPGVRLTDWLDKARAGDVPAAIVVAALMIFVGLLFVGIVGWAK